MSNTTPPYSLTVRDAAGHFGFHPATISKLIASGRLRRGEHYIKVLGGKGDLDGGRIRQKTLIIREAFIRFLLEQDGGDHGGQD